MPGAQPYRAPDQKLASSVTRGTRAGAPGASRVGRGTGATGPAATGGDWVAVEAEADIAAKGHAYISFDPAGTYP